MKMKLTPAVVQHAKTGRVLMLGYMNPESLRMTRQSGKVTFFSRSRKKLWIKGETSGNFLRVRKIEGDCDDDALLIQAMPDGPTCHTGQASCFDAGFSLDALDALLADRFKRRPKGSYVASLIRSGLDRIAQKVGEEAVETVIAAGNGSTTRLQEEAADLLFHLMILLRAKRTSIADVVEVLRRRNTKHPKRR